MNTNLKKIFFVIIYNSSLFILLIIGIQNNKYKSNINLLGIKTVNLPISFIIGTSFICGSITGNLLNLNLKKNN